MLLEAPEGQLKSLSNLTGGILCWDFYKADLHGTFFIKSAGFRRACRPGANFDQNWDAKICHFGGANFDQNWGAFFKQFGDTNFGPKCEQITFPSRMQMLGNSQQSGEPKIE